MDTDSRGAFDTDDISENYRRYLQPYLFDPWAQVLLNRVGLRPGLTVLDVAAGTGAVSRAAAAAIGPAGQVIASDISAAMLSWIPEQLPGESTAVTADAAPAPITTLVCSATDLDLPDESVDVVLCQQGLPFMPDRGAVAREMHRVLRPGGRVGIAVWSRGIRLNPFQGYADFLAEELPQSPFLAVMASGSLSMVPEEVASILEGAGFGRVHSSNVQLTVQWPTPLDEARGIGGTPFAPTISSLRSDRRERLISDLARHLADANGRTAPHISTSVIALGYRKGESGMDG